MQFCHGYSFEQVLVYFPQLSFPFKLFSVALWHNKNYKNEIAPAVDQ